MADLSMPDLTKTVKDAVYIAVGLGVLGFQRAQVRRVEFMRELESQRSRAQEQVIGVVTTVNQLSEPLRRVVLDRLGGPPGQP
jgi:hypothetical protein